MDIKKKYRIRVFIFVITYMTIFFLFSLIVSSNPAHKWLYILVESAIVGVLISQLGKVLKIDELRKEMNKKTE